MSVAALLISLRLGGLAVASALVALSALNGSRRRRKRERRLSRAFDRATLVQRTGIGVQGKPYSIYAEPAWKL